jgi:hypothetical protein
MIKEGSFGSKRVYVPINSGSWNSYNRTIFTWRADIEHREVSEIRSRNNNNNLSKKFVPIITVI